MADRKGRVGVSVVSGNAQESIAELQACLVITSPNLGFAWLLVSCTLLRIPITPRPVTWNLAFSALTSGGSSRAKWSTSLALLACLALGTSREDRWERQ